MSRKILNIGMCIGAPVALMTSPLTAGEEGGPSARNQNSEYAQNVAGMKKGTSPIPRKLVRVQVTPEKIVWKPLYHGYQSMNLRITGPGIDPYETKFAKGEALSFGFYDEESTIWADGVYNWELSAELNVTAEERELMKAARDEDPGGQSGELLRSSGVIPLGQDLVQSGHFRLDGGQVVRLKGEREQRRDQVRIRQAEAAGFVGDRDPLPTGVQLRDVVHVDDTIIQFSLCVGNDCVNGESFGFDTIRLKENNIRMHFQDTSTSASFPTNDWRFIFNDSSNGGSNYFALEDSTAGRQPFRVDAGAPANSLRVDSAGDVGVGTSNPVVDMHIVSGNTPTLRLEQNGSSGFTAQTWDLAGNEANFFLRDVTNGSKLSFRVEPNTPQDALYLEDTGDIGVGTNAPDSAVHVRRTSAGARTLLHLENNGVPTAFFNNTSGVSWNLRAGEGFAIDNPGEAGDEFLLGEDGELTVLGSVNGGSDRNAKQDIAEVDPQEILEKVAALPVSEWSYIRDSSKARHIGPMAQDFHAAFGLGNSDKNIGMLDGSGVALAAIKGLNEALIAKESELDALRTKTAELEAQVKMLIEKVGADESAD